MDHFMKRANILIYRGQIELIYLHQAAGKVPFLRQPQDNRHIPRIKYSLMNNGVIRQVTKLPIDRHIAIQRDALQYLAFFIRAGLPTGCNEHLDPIFARLLNSFKGTGWDGARYGAGQGIVHITEHRFYHGLSLIML